MVMKYRARTPLRLGLAGGGTDVPSFCDDYGGCVLNSTISLYANAILEPLDSGLIIFEAPDLQQSETFDSIENISDKDPLRLHKGVLARLISDFSVTKKLSFKLTTYADAPPGSGLGTSSTMVVCIIQVFAEWLGLPLGEYEIANLAYRIEREDLKLQGGKQDQYAATFGGFNFMEFSNSGTLVNPLRVKSKMIRELEQSIVLFYTGTSRDSASIISAQIESSSDRNSATTKALLKIKDDAKDLKAALLLGDINRFAKIIDASWVQKKLLSDVVSNPKLDGIYNAVMAAGGVAGKISGAGGGGFFMFMIEAERRPEVIRILHSFPGHVVPFTFEDTGSISWVST